MKDWDSPDRSRVFLFAAIAVALCGGLLSWSTSDYELARLEPTHGGRALVDIQSVPSSPAPVVAQTVAANEPAPTQDMRDAVAAVAQPPAASPVIMGAGRAGVFPGGASNARVSVQGPDAAAEAARKLSAPPQQESAAAFAEALEAVSAGRAARAANEVALQSASSGARLAENRRLLLRWIADSQAGAKPSAAGSSRDAAPSKTERQRNASLLIRAEAPAMSGADALERERAARRGPRKVRKPSLAKLLGRALRPPKGAVVPRVQPWTKARPAFGPDGKPLSVEPWPAAELDLLDAPEAARKDCKRKDAHWHQDTAGAYWHDGRSWARMQSGRWAWLERHDARWWAWPSPEGRPLVNHQDRWWLEAQGYWFLMHEGEPWGYWFIDRWGQEGFEHVSGQQFFYSGDEKIIAIVTPGRGAELYDASSGALVESFDEAHLPARLRLKPPTSLPQPR